MKKIKLEILGLSSSQSQSGSFALVLAESDGDRRLPIIIGMFEAQAIALEIEKIVPHRPMTHDLFKSFAHSFNFTIEEIVISDLKEAVFYAKIYCKQDDNTIEIDARPSDAIAIGIRFDVPIYTDEKILSEAGIVLLEESDEEEERQTGSLEKKAKPKPANTGQDLKDVAIDKLKQMLEKALKKEEYELAAKIRDEINRRN